VSKKENVKDLNVGRHAYYILIECLRDYKVQCEFRGIDFDADKTVQYEWLRKEMAKRHEENQSYFSLRSRRLVRAGKEETPPK
jgi:hypothetical protein